MAKILMSDLKEGMVLSVEVTNLHGQLLIPKSVVLKEWHLRLLKMWGVQQVEIEDEEEKKMPKHPLEQLSKAMLKKLRDQMDDLFAFVNRKDSFNRELYQLFLERKAERVYLEDSNEA